MKLFFAYLRSKRRDILLYLAFFLLFLLSFLLYRLPLGAVLYPAALCGLIGCVWLAVGFLRMRRTHGQLVLLQNLTAAMIDRLPPADTVPEEDYRVLIAELQRQAAEASANSAANFRDTVEYYTMWAHQIKTPISAMKLALQNEDTPLCRRLGADLFRIEQYVEMVLTFLRLEPDAGDYLFRPCRVDDLLRPVFRRFAPEFIDRRLRLVYEPTEITAVTDEKWLTFVLEQLLSNALKYTREGEIRVRAENGGVLCIEDTGIGIAPGDLPRVFDKGFTGCNGRTDKSASGLGLYLCRRICDNLGVGISVTSEVGRGTAIRLDLRQSGVKAD